ncbi:signal recognition particle, SRP9/SRP14 subunit [Podospora appendiculata]|uniref:Signal recognition particle subunit SRP14 n=1 Tax=Podospora appendiculata TaxID=314037 RepID=A0AAE0XCK6_9PEZI|nr:signal recognition particle, SRP9/SRP14 subunit [Podospora appendiculata]
MGVLTNEEFFTKLAGLFESGKDKDHGAIYLTQKRLSYDQDDALAKPTAEDSFADLHPTKPLPVLIRASNNKGKKERGEKVKLSTVVEPADLEAFFGRYAEVCRAGMAALKPRDRTKRKAKARKKKVGGAGQTAMSAIP